MVNKLGLFFTKLFNLLFNLVHYKKRLTELEEQTNYFLNLAFTSTNSIVDLKAKRSRHLIVSLTTYNRRIDDVHLVIESIAQQTVKPNQLILWLDEDEFTLETIPLILQRQIERGLEVRFCPNYKSYKKLIPTLKLFPQANIITVDDDILYPHDMIEILLKEHSNFPNCILGNRVRQLRYNRKNELLRYKYWPYIKSDIGPSSAVIAIGVGGVFYPANSLHKDVLDFTLFSKLSPNADDLWFKVMAIKNHIMHKKVNDSRLFEDRFLTIKNSQKAALYHSNLTGNENDLQIKRLFEYFNL